MQTDASEERLSKYELLRPLGSGGMGEVYLARDLRLHRQVAIKFVSAPRLADAAANARLLREARAAATLDHPGICPVYDVDVDALGRTCIVMQYVEGETLAKRLARGPLDPAEVRELGAAIADALAAAHARGIVHRDLKPQNVIVTPDGRPKLLDFGIAVCEVPADAAEVVTHTATHQWAADSIAGTPAYMSPEQVLRKPIDARSDLFALGAVLFECLTGRPAFLAATDIETWARVVYADPPPPSSLNPRVTAALDAAVARLLQKDPAARFGSARDTAAALREGAAAPAVEARGRVRPWIAAAVLAAVALGGYGTWRIVRPRAAAPPPPAAQEYYDRGLQYLRDGAYARAEKVLAAAVGIHPQYPQALARLAEARNELDEDTPAQDAILRIADLTRAGLVLPKEDGVRVDAISALLENDLPRAEAGYRSLAEANPDDRGAWLDLARVRQEAGLKPEALAAAQRALSISPNYAAAHLRMGALAASSLRRDDAIREFREAVRLYALDSLTEGEAEAMLQEAYFLDAIGDYTASRQMLADADRLLALAESPYQQARALMLRSSLAASSGDMVGAGALAGQAVATAQGAGLDAVAADALIQSASPLQQKREYAAARDVLQRGVDLAKRSGAKGVALRGTLQLAAVFLSLDQPVDARNLANGMLDFARSRYPRYEMIALSIVARSLEDSDPRAAEASARTMLAKARSLHDDRELATALDGVIGPAVTLGSLPEALGLRGQLEQLQRQLHDMTNLSINLAGRADLLIRLGRAPEAEEPLREIEAEAARGNEAFTPRVRRALVLRAVAASEARDFTAALARLDDLAARSAAWKSFDSTSALAEALLLNARAALGRKPPVRPWSALPPASISSELRYWRATATLATGDAAGAAAEAATALADLDRKPSAEFEWRMAAIAAVAARRSGDPATAADMEARAQGALGRLRSAWGQDAAAYERRADLAELKRAAGIS